MLKKRWRLGREPGIEPLHRRPRGQSVVELAIAFPILLMLFVGLMEVGLILHSYLVLVNANREAARYAARAPQFVDEQLNDITNDVIADRAIATASPKGIRREGLLLQ